MNNTKKITSYSFLYLLTTLSLCAMEGNLSNASGSGASASNTNVLPHEFNFPSLQTLCAVRMAKNTLSIIQFRCDDEEQRAYQQAHQPILVLPHPLPSLVLSAIGSFGRSTSEPFLVAAATTEDFPQMYSLATRQQKTDFQHQIEDALIKTTVIGPLSSIQALIEIFHAPLDVVNRRLTPPDVRAVEISTPLRIAVTNRHYPQAQYLFSRMGKADKKRLLLDATDIGDYDFIQCVTNYFNTRTTPDADDQEIQRHKNRMLERAAAHGYARTVLLLINLGAKDFGPNNTRPATTIARQNGHNDIAIFLENLFPIRRRSI